MKINGFDPNIKGKPPTTPLRKGRGWFDKFLIFVCLVLAAIIVAVALKNAGQP